MKKLFSSSKQDSQYDSFVGKQYLVGDLTLVVEEVIAEGGFSYVFLVKDNHKNKNYALKRMLVNSQSDLDNCKQEITIMKAFHRHQAIVSFKGHHTKHIGNGIYEVLLLMQHCPNGTVVDLMNKHIATGLSEALIRQIFTGIVDAVCLLHSNGYTHRDIKVENILIGPNNEYVLCDFGSAYKGTMNPETQGHNLVEDNVNRFTTLSYRAPEMCDLYLGYEIGAPADVWALGVLLYKLCFFTTPFEENTLAIARAKYTMPATADRYSDNLLSVIRETLVSKPSDRLSAKQVLSRLKEGNKSKKSSKAVSSSKISTAASTAPAPSSKVLSPVTSAEISCPPSTRSDPTSNEEIKSRSRPRGNTKHDANLGLIGPPCDVAARDSSQDMTTSRDCSSVAKEHASTLPRKNHVAAPAESRDVVSPGERKPRSQTEGPKSTENRNQRSASLQFQSSSFVSEDPWGNAFGSAPISQNQPVQQQQQQQQQHQQPPPSREKVSQQRSLPAKTITELRSSGNQQPDPPSGSFAPPPAAGTLPETRDTVSPIVFLPPPPSSPSYKSRSRPHARGHSRAKSDTTCFQGMMSFGGSFHGDAESELSSSSGELTGVKQVTTPGCVNKAESRSAEKIVGVSSSNEVPLLLLPPPTSSPKPRAWPSARGHSRTKSDTTFLRGFAALGGHADVGCYGSTMIGDVKMTGHEADEKSLGSHGNRSVSSNFDNSQLPSPEDEFLKLSLRAKGSSQTRLDEIPAQATPSSKSSKVERSKTQVEQSHRDPDLSLSNELRSCRRALSNESVAVLPPESLLPRRGMSLSCIPSTKSTKPKKKLHFFGRRKVLSQEDFVTKYSHTYSRSVVGNPLHDNLNT